MVLGLLQIFLPLFLQVLVNCTLNCCSIYLHSSLFGFERLVEKFVQLFLFHGFSWSRQLFQRHKNRSKQHAIHEPAKLASQLMRPTFEASRNLSVCSSLTKIGQA